MRCVGKLAIIIISLVGCRPSAPTIDFCGLYDAHNANCVPTIGGKEEYQLTTEEMLGYQCLSPQDIAASKSYLNNILERLDACEGK